MRFPVLKTEPFIFYYPYIYLGYFTLSVCLSVTMSVTIVERSTILLVFVIKLTKETRRRGWGVDEPKKTGARSAGARTRGQNPLNM